MADGSEPVGEEELSFSELPLVAPGTNRGCDVRIGPFSMVGREGSDPVTIGDRTVIEDHVLIEPGVIIGEDCFIEDHCRIGRGSVLPAGTRMRSGVRGSDDTGRRHAAPAPVSGPENASVSPRALVAGSTVLGEGVEIGPFAIVGWEGEPPVTLGPGTKVEPFALIESGVTLGAECLVDAYCRIAAGSTIGDRSQVLYGAAVFESAVIGKGCIVGGNVADRTVIEDFVTYFGEIAHDYRKPRDLAAWDGVESPSPTIRARAVVGQNAVIIGKIEVGAGSYVGAGEIVRVNVPAGHLLRKGEHVPLGKLRGFVSARTDGTSA
jgi:UDP-3-O-[3-hydroxymyristoyl] glucosamine N-acyltransferase